MFKHVGNCFPSDHSRRKELRSAEKCHWRCGTQMHDALVTANYERSPVPEKSLHSTAFRSFRSSVHSRTKKLNNRTWRCFCELIKAVRNYKADQSRFRAWLLGFCQLCEFVFISSRHILPHGIQLQRWQCVSVRLRRQSLSCLPSSLTVAVSRRFRSLSLNRIRSRMARQFCFTKICLISKNILIKKSKFGW